MPSLSLEALFSVTEFLGICVFALSGMILARRKNFDPVGLYVIACVTAFGGGTLRDLILDVQPVYWVSRWEYPVVILVMTAIFYFSAKLNIKESWLITPDAMGLALFSITGAQVAMAQGMPLIIVSILGVMTATFGGLIRDTLCSEIPMIFTKVNFYASTSFTGIWLYISLDYMGVNLTLNTMLSISFIFIFRMLSYRFNWRFT
jgi:uncharacterized membrane protein YeiH